MAPYRTVPGKEEKKKESDACFREENRNKTGLDLPRPEVSVRADAYYTPYCACLEINYGVYLYQYVELDG